jgi:hypothetical protein
LLQNIREYSLRTEHYGAPYLEEDQEELRRELDELGKEATVGWTRKLALSNFHQRILTKKRSNLSRKNYATKGQILQK